MTLECCIDSIASANNVLDVVDSIEICDNLKAGGTSPSFELIDEVVAAAARSDSAKPILRVLVRCRAGDFVYNTEEIGEMETYVTEIKRRYDPRSSGVVGLVIGFLTLERRVDVELTRRFISLIKPTFTITFHRAIDEALDPLEAFKTIHTSLVPGVDRVLTSGERTV